MLDHPNTAGTRIVVGLATLVVMAICNSLFQRVSRNPKLKHGVFVVYLIVFTIVFLVLVLVASGQPAALLAAVPIAVFYVAMQLVRTSICGSCGQTVVSRQWFSGATHCPSCNASLGQVRRSHT